MVATEVDEVVVMVVEEMVEATVEVGKVVEMAEAIPGKHLCQGLRQHLPDLCRCFQGLLSPRAFASASHESDCQSLSLAGLVSDAASSKGEGPRSLFLDAR